MANEYSQELKQTLAANPRITKVWFDEKGNYYFNAFPRGDGFVVGNKSVTAVSREEILGAKECEPKSIQEMKFEELRAVCIDAKYPEDEWKGFKKKTDLIEYITGKQSNQ